MKFITLLVFIVSIQAFAQVPPTNRPGYCPMVENTICEDFVISKLSKWDYDEESEYNQIRRSCSGNYEDACLKRITKPLSRHSYNDLDEMVKLANSCKLSHSSCIDFVASKIGSFDFNSVEDVTKVAKACARSEVRCIQRRCDTRDYNCSRTNDVLRAAKNCYRKCYYPN